MKLAWLLVFLAGCATTPIRQNSIKLDLNLMGFLLVGYPEIYVPFRDSNYRSMSVEEVKKLPSFRVRGGNRSDCDEAAYRAFVHVMNQGEGKAFGVAYITISQANPFISIDEEVGYHALNFFIDAQMNVHLYDPQTKVEALLDQCLKEGWVKETTVLIL